MKTIGLLLITAFVVSLNYDMVESGRKDNNGGKDDDKKMELSVGGVKKLLKEKGLGEKLKNKFKQFFDACCEEDIKWGIAQILHIVPQSVADCIMEELEKYGVKDCTFEDVAWYVWENLQEVDKCDLVPFLEDLFCLVTVDIVKKCIAKNMMSEGNWCKQLCDFIEGASVEQIMGCVHDHLMNLTCQEGEMLLRDVVMCLLGHFGEREVEDDNKGCFKVKAEMVEEFFKKCGAVEVIKKFIKENVCKENPTQVIDDFFKCNVTERVIGEYLECNGLDMTKDEVISKVKQYFAKNPEKCACGLVHLLAHKLADFVNGHLESYLQGAKQHIEQQVMVAVQQVKQNPGCLANMLRDAFSPEEIGYMAVDILEEALRKKDD